MGEGLRVPAQHQHEDVRARPGGGTGHSDAALNVALLDTTLVCVAMTRRVSHMIYYRISQITCHVRRSRRRTVPRPFMAGSDKRLLEIGMSRLSLRGAALCLPGALTDDAAPCHRAPQHKYLLIAINLPDC